MNDVNKDIRGGDVDTISIRYRITLQCPLVNDVNKVIKVKRCRQVVDSILDNIDRQC